MRKVAFFGLVAAAMLMAFTVLGDGSRAYASNPCSVNGVHQLCVADSSPGSVSGTTNYLIQGCGFLQSKKTYVQVNGFGPPTHSLMVPVDANGCISTWVNNVANSSCISAYQSGVKNAIYIRVANGAGTPGC